MNDEGDREVAKLRNKPTIKTMKLHNKILGLAAAGAVLLASVGSANAVPTIKYRINGSGMDPFTTVVDDMAGDVASATAGGIGLFFDDGQFSFTVVSATTKPAAGSAALPVMSLNVNATAKASAPAVKTLEIWFSETDFGPTSAALLTDLSSTGVASWMGSSYVDDANVAFSTTSLLAMLSTSNTGSVQPVASALPTDPFTSYSLTTYLKLTISAGSTANGNLTVRANLPDGGSTVAFLGMALVAVEGLRRKFVKA